MTSRTDDSANTGFGTMGEDREPASSLALSYQDKTTAASRMPTPRPPTLKRPGDRPGESCTIPSSSTLLGDLTASRRPISMKRDEPKTPGANLPQDLAAKMKAFHLQRQGPPMLNTRSPRLDAMDDKDKAGQGEIAKGYEAKIATTSAIGEAGSSPENQQRVKSSPTTHDNLITRPPGGLVKKGLAAKRGMKLEMKLSDAMTAAVEPLSSDRTEGPSDDQNGTVPAQINGSLFNKYSEYVDTNSGTLNFKGKATINGQGIEFSGGKRFDMSLDEVDTLDELGKGNYGTVYKVRHARPQMRKPGQGLASNKSLSALTPTVGQFSAATQHTNSTSDAERGNRGTIMAMKEIRLELDEAKFAAIIMELDVLHRCISPFIVDFYGAFFQEGAVYICMEYMDGGSIDKLYGNGVPENVLRKIARGTIIGLKVLKEEHNIIHRDVKPTNILVNTSGHVKICDFGVSGNLVASIAKTNIGCQSYMAPERISGGGISQPGLNIGQSTYSVQSDIWSLGLTIIECALGRYPYPPETYDNIFSQLSAIVDGDPPDLPPDTYSEAARDFVRQALNKVPKLRPTYAMLLNHPWLLAMTQPITIEEEPEDLDDYSLQVSASSAHTDTDIATWVTDALRNKQHKSKFEQRRPALDTAPMTLANASS